MTTHAYLRVSTQEQADSGAGLDAQRAAIERYCAARQITVDRWHVDAGVSGSIAPRQRPALNAALGELRRGDQLLVAKLDRLLRRLTDLITLRDQADHDGWAITAADGTVDMSTPYGRALAAMIGVFAELERELIGQRTRDALQARKAGGTRLGRRVTLASDVRQRIVDERSQGHTLQEIADHLNDERVPTKQGGRSIWWGSSVRAVLRSVELDELAAANRQRRLAGVGG